MNGHAGELLDGGDDMTGAIFVDRDGVICENRDDYVKSWTEFQFVPGAAEALCALSTAGQRLFVVTNQSAVGRGILPRDVLDEINGKMIDVLRAAGARIDDVLVCPHAPEEKCACRKPADGLLREAAGTHHIDLERSWMVGDAETDVAAGLRAGCGAVLVLTGRGARQLRKAEWRGGKPDFVAHDLVDAAIWILGRVAEHAGSALEVTHP